MNWGVMSIRIKIVVVFTMYELVLMDRNPGDPILIAYDDDNSHAAYWLIHMVSDGSVNTHPMLYKPTKSRNTKLPILFSTEPIKSYNLIKRTNLSSEIISPNITGRLLYNLCFYPNTALTLCTKSLRCNVCPVLLNP